jgi:branched-chain amino acid transport system substrate-binding protein
MKFDRNAIGRIAAVIIVIVILVVAAAGATAYFLVTRSTSTPTSTSTPSSTLTTSSSQSAAAITIGVITPETGPYASIGALSVGGVELAIDQINAAGGVLGKNLSYVVQDESVNPLTAAEILVTQYHVQYIVGPFFSGDVLAVLPYTFSNKVVVLCPECAEDNITYGSDASYFFQVQPQDKGYANVIYNWMNLIGAKSVTYVGEDYLYAHEIYSDLTGDLNSSYSSSSLFYPGDATDYSATISQISAAHPAAVAVIMSGDNGIAFAKQYGANPITSKIPVLYVGSVLEDPTYANSVDASVPGALQNAFIESNTSPTNTTQAFEQAYLQAFGSPAGYEESTFNYQCVEILAHAIASAGTTNTTAVAAALDKTNYYGPAGHLVFNLPLHYPILGAGYYTGFAWQLQIKNGSLYYEPVWPSQVANFTAINPSTGNPY